MSEFVLDASAMLACLNGETGGDEVARLTSEERCLATAVNWAEVLSKLMEWGMSSAEAFEAASSLSIEVVAFDAGLARRCAELRPLTRAQGLSLGDRACLALAERLRVPVLTADRPGLELAGPLNLEIRCIRPETN
ncbi:MAG: type II toxin-antitoxin system VapC family toxin [Rhodocyclaceae bacterium]|nr:type II toxin-antitoxin system VapC family toxin [Rhodocyclaceae bacterium]